MRLTNKGTMICLGVLVMAILLSRHFGRVRNSAPHP